MAVDWRAFARSSGGSNTHIVASPASTVVGDYLLVSFNWTAGPNVVTIPAGWAQIIAPDLTNSGQHMAAYGFFATQAGAVNYTFSSSGFVYDVVCIALTGVRTTSPIDVMGTVFSDATTAASITTTVPNAFLVFLCTFHDTGITGIAPPAGMTERIDGLYSNAPEHYVATELRPTAGATGIRGALVTGGGNIGGAALVALAPNLPPNVTTATPTGTITTVTPLLRTTVTDPEGAAGNRAYFQVAADSAFTNVVFQGYGSTVNSGLDSTLRVSPKLNDSTTYHLRALGEDALGAQSAYSATSTFTTPAPIIASYVFTGGAQTFVVPANVTSVAVDAYGAKGGGTNGGLGGRTQGSITVTPSETLNIYVGGAGAKGENQVSGGYNGGGGTGDMFNGGDPGAGGGAADIRRGGVLLANRVVVAAGGGGSGGFSQGGGGGGSTGVNGVDGPYGAGSGGRGGTQTAGGLGGVSTYRNEGTINDGVLGAGGRGQGSSSSGTPGGGGGGFYGGGGGADTARAIDGTVSYEGSGGGGGSSLVPAGGTTTSGVRDGNGAASLTYSRFDDAPNTPPTAPTVTTPDTTPFKSKFSSGVTIAWIHNDLDGHVQNAYAITRTKAGGVAEWWNSVTQAWLTTSTYNATSTTGVPFPKSAWRPGTYTFQISTTDPFGGISPYSAARTIQVLTSGLSMIV